MDIEEVIAIAKTLRSDAYYINASTTVDYRDEDESPIYWIQLNIHPDEPERYHGNSWEEALRAAGWKG